MKKIYLFLMMGFLCYTAQAQIPVTVTNPGQTTPTLQPYYPSLALALNDLNLLTAMNGPVKFTLAAGNETAPPTGFTIGSTSLNAALSAMNTVTIMNTGNTAILNAGIGSATPTSPSPDGILKLTGADFITIDGLTLTDGNTTNPQTMEFGIALFKLNASDGANNNRIQNCTINMQRINNATAIAPLVEGAVGIGVYNSAAGTATSAFTPASAAGSNSNNKFYTNSINGGNYGIAIIGYAAPSPYTSADQNNDIGGSASGTGNSILNYGGAPAAANLAAGIRTLAQYNFNVRYNTVNNNTGAGVNHVSTLRGIYLGSATSASATVSNNNVTIHGGGTGSQLSGIENLSGTTYASNTINLNNNVVTGDYLTATSGTFYGIFNSAAPATVNIQNNNISNITYSSAALTGTGVVYPLYNTGVAINVNVLSNTINNISRTGTTGGTTIGIFVQNGTNQTVNGNTVSNMNIDGTGFPGIMYGILTGTGTIVCNNNNVFNLACLKTSGTNNLFGIYNSSAPPNENYNNNQVNNIAHSGTGLTIGIYTASNSGVRTVSGNTVHSISSAGLNVAGITQASSSPTVFQNKIYNISSSSAGAPSVLGLSIGFLGNGGTANIYNNLIGDLKAPNAVTAGAGAPTLSGIYIGTNTISTNIFLDFNTVYIAGTGGAAFGTAALFVNASPTNTTANLTMRNNILVNVSTPAGAGFSAVAYQRSTVDLANYNTASNNNLFYAATPGLANLIFFDGTNPDQDLAAFKTRVSPTRESNSLSFAPSFLSTAGANANFLHIDPAAPSSAALADAGVTISTITTDFDAQLRSTPPDIGADEFITFGAVVPVATEYFRGSKLAGLNYLDWKVNCTSEPYVILSLERSADGRNFKSVNDQTAPAVRCQQGFNFTDNSPLAGVNYYRLKTTTADGKFRYSAIVALINREKGFELISISPNPVKTNATLSVSTVKGGIMNVSVTDVTGKVVMKQSLTVIAGNNPVNMNFGKLGAGTYSITVINAENEIKTARFVKY